MTTPTPEPYTPTHVWVAEKMDYSVSGVSLLRTGQRRPAIRTMEAVQKAFGWTVEDQVAHRHDYPTQFNKVLAQYWADHLEQQHQKDCRHHHGENIQ